MRTSLLRNIASGLASAWLALGALLRPVPAMAIEEPAYRQIQAAGDFSLRLYAPVIVAETDVDGSLYHASSVGFRRLAGYIFGGNHPAGGGTSTKIAMTAPVTAAARTKIAMTAPVSTEQRGAGWTVGFTMPAGYSLATLPQPDDARVRLRAVPEVTMAVVRFSGWVDEAKVAAETALLRSWMAAQGVASDGEPRLARYNPPWTLPFLRRNEILIPCHTAQAGVVQPFRSR